ncbi:MAG: Fe-S cluster assembly protein SufB [Candidatus Kerfeldbacteria bacterium]|nr:Fe-S cluster assembly protein SufB [Candidatus Kerfeldbacteria bacterium]
MIPQKTIEKTDAIFAGLNRDTFDHKNQSDYAKLATRGLSEALVRKISTAKHEPDWMLQKRLEGLRLFLEKPLPNFGPDLSALNFEEIIFYVAPGETAGTDQASKSWDDVSPDIKRTFERLGIPEAEKKMLAGVGAQYESTTVYHRLKERWEKLGVIFEDMDVAVQKYPELVQKYFMTRCVPVNDHKFAALHAAVWSGGTFLYVPAGVKVDAPLQAYFRMNAENMGQFEHTLMIIEDGAEAHYIEGCSAPKYGTSSLHAGCVEVFVQPNARFRYSSVENWSRDTYNLNTKRALVAADARMEWVGGNMGSCVTMLYPCSILQGERAHAEHLGIAFAGAGQVQDTGAKVIHSAPNTTSSVIMKSLSKDGGHSIYRGLLTISPRAKGSVAKVKCDALLLDDHSTSETIPDMNVHQSDVTIAHEATVGQIGEEEVFYLMSRGLTEQAAHALVVNGFIEPIVKSLPLEYAVEMNRLIELEMEGSVG